MSRRIVLIVEDDVSIRAGLKSFLESKGFEVEAADSIGAGERVLDRVLPDAAVLDYELPDGVALDLLPKLRERAPQCPVLVLTGHGTIELAVQAIQAGAANFLTKPIELPALIVMLERAIENQRARQNQQVGRARRSRKALDPFVGASARIRTLREEAQRALHTESPVLILGPTGSGKGVLANWIHANGPRADEPFVELNCAGLSRELLDSELFGHEKGAFTGALAAKPGLLEAAHRGTVFLDEIGDMDLSVQAKLLKVLEDRRFRRLGGLQDRQVDIHLLAATHHNLKEQVRDKKFREDLFYRVSVIPLDVPPLRERIEDLPALVERILERLAPELGRSGLQATPGAIAALMRYPWPGNVRELRNVLERAALRSRDVALEAADLQFESLPEPAGEPGGADESLAALERRHIARVLEEENGNVERASARLGLPRSTLYQKIKALGLRQEA